MDSDYNVNIYLSHTFSYLIEALISSRFTEVESDSEQKLRGLYRRQAQRQRQSRNKLVCSENCTPEDLLSL